MIGRRTAWHQLLVLWLLAGAALGTTVGAVDSWDGTWQLAGWVGPYPTSVVLEAENLRVQGTYSYERFPGTIPLLGIVDRSGALLMFELDEDHYRTGTFEGILSAGGFSGHWTDRDAKRLLAVQWDTIARDIWSGHWKRTFIGADGQRKWALHESASVDFRDWDGTEAAMEIWAYSGAHVGFAAGEVHIDGRQAMFQDDDEGGTFHFERRGNELIVTTEGTQGMGGVGVSFDGVYKRDLGPDANATLWDLGVFPTAELDQTFRDLVGESYYQKYLSAFHLLQFSEDHDGLNAVVVDGYVRGLGGHTFGRIMYTEDGYFAAAISEGDGWLTYISNHPLYEFRVPKTFEDLRDRLAFG